MNTEKKTLPKLVNDSDRCPVRGVLHHIGDKWSITIIHILGQHGTLRFGEISYVVNGISQKMLTATLKTLEADGLIMRKHYSVIPPKVEYTLTELGRDLLPILLNLVEWATRNLSQIATHQAHYQATNSQSPDEV